MSNGISQMLFQGQQPIPVPTGSDTSSNFPLFLQTGVYDTVNAGMNLAQQPFTPFPGQQVYTPSAQTTQAQQLAGSNVGDWQPALSSGQGLIGQGGALAGEAANLTNQAAQPIGASQINNFLNPYTNDVVGALQQQSNTNFEQNVLPSIQSQFVSAGQAASPQQMQADNNALLAQQQALNPAVSQALQTGYQGALGAAQQQQQEQMAGAGQLGNMASLEGSLGSEQAQTGALQSQLGSFDVANLSAAGQQQDTLSQENINAQISDFNQQQAYPYQQLGFESSLLNGLPVGQTSQTATEAFPSAFGSSPFSTAVGTSLGASALGIGAARGGHVRRGALQGYAAGGRSLVRTASYGDYPDTERQMARGGVVPFKRRVAGGALSPGMRRAA